MAFEDTEGHWEPECGKPYRKLGMTLEHNDLMMELAGRLCVSVKTKSDSGDNVLVVLKSSGELQEGSDER